MYSPVKFQFKSMKSWKYLHQKQTFFISFLDTLCLYIKVFKYKPEKGEHILTNNKKPQVQWSTLFATHKLLCSSYTHPMKHKPHVFPDTPLRFSLPNSENISCIAGIKMNYFVYNNRMNGLRMTPEMCVFILLGHRLPLQSQSICSVSLWTLQSLLGWEVLL